jgi:hypothetical protein
MIFENAYEKKLTRLGVPQPVAKLLSDPTDETRAATGNSGSGITNFNSLADIPTNYTGSATVAGVAISMVNGWITAPSLFRLNLQGTGNITISTTDSTGAVVASAFTYTLPSQAGIKSYAADTITLIKIVADAGVTVSWLG